MKNLKLQYCSKFNTFKISYYKYFYKLGYYFKKDLFLKFIYLMLIYKLGIKNSTNSLCRIIKQLRII